MSDIAYDKILDAKDLNCPMPVVKARKEILTLEPGQVLKILATDRGSIKDFEGWAKVEKKIELLAQETETDDGRDIYVHYLKRAS